MRPVTRVFDEPGLLVQECGNRSYSLAGRLAYIGVVGKISKLRDVSRRSSYIDQLDHLSYRSHSMGKQTTVTGLITLRMLQPRMGGMRVPSYSGLRSD